MEENRRIASKDNPQVKLATALLRQKKERDRTGCFVAEGLRLCRDAAESGVRIRALLLTDDAAEKSADTDFLAGKSERIYRISQSVAEKIADTKTTQGVYAVCEKLDIHRCAATIKGSGLYLLLDTVQDPGNLGAALRTADAMGIDGVFLSEGCADLYSPKVLRSAMGGVFRLPVEAGADLAAIIGRMRALDLPVYAAALREGAADLETLDFSDGGGVLIGNEGNGLSEHLITSCTGSAIIPMAEGANSLNAAVAAGIILWEMSRGRRRTKGE